MVDPLRILLADDDPTALRLLRHYIETAGFKTICVSNGTEAIEHMAREDIACAIVDLDMPGANGIECVRSAKQLQPDMPVMVVSGCGEIDDAVGAMKLGAFDYFEKPVERDALLARLREALRTAKLARENNTLRRAVSSSMPSHPFVAEAPATKDVIRLAKRIAPIDSTALITGPSGAGKSTLARMIHQMGPRHKGPFVDVSCAALPRDLIEAELFGHERGAFTGAIATKPGRIETAEGGTLFLDEVGDLPLDLQPKLLAFLQDRQYLRIGGVDTLLSNVRLIAATNRSLEDMVNRREFREELYYRLNVLPIALPSLRDRPEDIPVLLQSTLERIGNRRNTRPCTLTRAAHRVLREYLWPGNVREMENVLERASAYCENHEIHVENLDLRPLRLTDHCAPSNNTQQMAGKTLRQLEREAIVATLRSCKGNKAATARSLGISEKSVYNKIKRHELDPSAWAA